MCLLFQGHEPEVTNADDFDSRVGLHGVRTNTLDYIWFTPDTLAVTGVLETLPPAVVLHHTGLPSVRFPSDHIPLQAAFSFRKR